MWWALLLFAGVAWAQWSPQVSNTTASMRGVSAVSGKVAWASGTGGTFLRTVDGGKTWVTGQVPSAQALDFRDVEAFDADRAMLMSIGPGEQSQLYRTKDGGGHWDLIRKNELPLAFYDAIAFWGKRTHGLLLGDAVDGRMYVLSTVDGGTSWARVEAGSMPPAREGEGAFAASGTCLVTGPAGYAWFGTGGTGGGRVYRTHDWGKTWTAAETPIPHANASSGVFSVAFRNRTHGVAVGGDYTKPGEGMRNIAVTSDGGITWTLAETNPPGFYSAVAYLPGTKRLIAGGTRGFVSSDDDGRTWVRMAEGNFNAMSFARSGRGWAVGPKGAIAVR